MSTSTSHKSPYVPSVQFRDDVESKAVEPYVEKKVRDFFQARKGVDSLEEVCRVESEDAITDIDFSQRDPEDGSYAVDFKYIRKVVMEEAQKVDGQIDHTAYTLTFDHDLTPSQCSQTGIYYGCLKLASEPVLYYVRLDLAELIAEVRNHNFLP